MWIWKKNNLSPLYPIPCQLREPLAAFSGEAGQGGHTVLRKCLSARINSGLTLHQGTNLCPETVLLFTCSVPGHEATPRRGPSCRERIGGWCCAAGSWQGWQGCGARLESCAVGQCTCASGCQSPSISRVLDSWEHNAGMLM